MKRIYLVFLILLSLNFSWAQPPKREVRAVWMTTLGGLDWPRAKAHTATGREQQKQELCQRLDELQQTGINTVYLQTRVRGSVIYPSQIEPWDVALTGQYNRDPGYDPLAFAIQECHNRGMELHAWVVTIPCFKVQQARLIGRKSLIFTHPKLLFKQNDTYYMDPSREETAQYLASICREITQNYDIDGIHFDYIRYPEGTKRDRQQWRRDNITNVVRKCYTAIKSLKPWVRVSCSPVGKYDNLSRYSARGWAAYSTVFQDAKGWLRDGIMDMLSPMMYFQGDNFFPFAIDWQEGSYGRTIAPGLGIYFLSPAEKDWDLHIITSELHFMRQQGLGGQAYFRNRFLMDNVKGLQSYLRDQFYTTPALLPAMTWQSDAVPSPPQIASRQTNGTICSISFAPQTNNGAPCRHVIYSSNSYPVDINNPRNIVRVVWGGTYSYDMLTLRLYGLYMAATTLDAYGNESTATEL